MTMNDVMRDYSEPTPAAKRHTTADGDHEIRLDPRGVWQVFMVGDDLDEFPLFEATDFEICVEAVAEVVAEYAEHGDSDWDGQRDRHDFRAYGEAARFGVPEA